MQRSRLANRAAAACLLGHGGSWFDGGLNWRSRHLLSVWFATSWWLGHLDRGLRVCVGPLVDADCLLPAAIVDGKGFVTPCEDMERTGVRCF